MEEFDVKKFIATGCAVAALAAMSVSTAFAGECSASTLKGHYTYWLQGYTAAGKPYAEVGQEHFDGAGKVTTESGVAGSAKIDNDTGAYTVNDDCTGMIKYASGASDKIFVAPSGDSFVFSSAKKGVVQSGEDTRVAKD